MHHGLTDRELWILLRKQLTGQEYDEFFGGEYDKLVSHPQVKDLVVKRDGFTFLSPAHFTIPDGRTFYIATFRLTVDTGRLLTGKPWPEVCRVTVNESGRRDGASGHLYNNSTGFCFGAVRTSVLTKLLKSGELFAFAMTAIDSFSHVNTKDVPVLATEFRERRHPSHHKLLPEGKDDHG